MDLPLILSMVAIAVSVSMSIITLLLTEFQGPNISLLNAPKCEFSGKGFTKEQMQRWTPNWLSLEPIPLVFANYGGKAGTILDLKFDFVPHKSFKKFFESFDFRFEEPNPPVIIREGDNQDLLISPSVRTIDWKKTALVEVLASNLKASDAIAKALNKSKEEFEKFCDFLDESQEIGKISCNIVLTKGRFKTKVKEEKLFEDVPITNNFIKASVSLRDCLVTWENLSPTSAELLNEIERSLKDLIRELRGSLGVLGSPVDEQNVNAYTLRVDEWNRLHRLRTSKEMRIRWFLIESEKGLKEDLTKLYKDISKYDVSLGELRALGELRTQKHFQTTNEKGKQLLSNVAEILKRLTDLQRRSVS